MAVMPARNAPCPCGSGKKSKSCCAAHSHERAASLGNQSRGGAGTGVGNQANAATQLARSRALGGLGKIDEALAAAREALRLRPDWVDAHTLQGHLLSDLSRDQEAIAGYKEALRLAPDHQAALLGLADALVRQGNPEEAVAWFQQAVEQPPHYPEAHNNFGNALTTLGRQAEAVEQYERALALCPGYAAAAANLGVALHALGRNEEAISACLEAIRHDPTLSEPHGALGDIFSTLNLTDDAISAYREAIRLRPTFLEAWCNLGNAFLTVGRYGEAANAYETAIALEPGRGDLYANAARIYLALDREEDAFAAYTRALAAGDHLSPAAIESLFLVARTRCLWQDLESLSERYRGALREAIRGTGPVMCGPFHAIYLPLAPEEQRALVDRVGAHVVAPFLKLRPSLPPAPLRHPDQRLRVGYLSWDFRNHAVAHLMGHLFARHDRARLEAIAYSTGPNDHSEYRARIEAEAERFVDLQGLTPLQAAGRIRLDGVDILVDLSGHTGGMCLPALALRPAPIQVHFLGYPSTVGKDLVDYIFVDEVICPPGHESYFSESVYRLPDCYQINDRQPIGDTLPRAAYGLPEQGFIFCCFNQGYKLTPSILDAWLRLVAQVPESVLWLYRSNERMEENLRQEARVRAFPQERLVFGGALPKEQHLARLRHAGLVLDTPMYNAMTTASDALWAGAPVLSVLGESFPERVGASLLTAIGLPELIMPDLAAYEATAIRLATSPEELEALRLRLAANRLTYPLFDPDRFARKLEAAYEDLWARRLDTLTHASPSQPTGGGL